MKTIAIIPARGGSKRIPRKNIIPFLGKPMISYTIKSTLDSGVFDDVIVSTEDKEIANIAEEYGARVISRPDTMATDTAHELEACAHVLDVLKKNENYQPDAFCVVYPTAVLLAPEDFTKSKNLLAASPDADVVMGVSRYQIHPYKGLVTNDDGYLEMMFPEECMQRSQTYPHVVASNGSLYWVRTKSFRVDSGKGYYYDRLVPYEIPFERVVDIDEPEDVKWAEMIAKYKSS